MYEDNIKSIKLGFKGKLTPEYYEKLASTKQVRKRLKIELLFGISLMTISLYMILASIITENNSIVLISIISFGLLFSIMLFLIVKNLLIWREIYGIENERIKEYNTRKDNDNA